MYTNYPIIIERSEYGYYAECPFIQGAYAQGDTEDEAKNNLKEVIIMTIQDMRERGDLKTITDQSSMPSITLSSLSLAI